MRIVVDVVPHSAQRYPTVGDWVFQGEDLCITVSALGDPNMEFLVALHEMIEAMVCDKAGIAEIDVQRFDTNHPELDDPGGDRRAPYHRQHVFAENIERMVAQELGVNWNDYTRRVDSL